MSFPLKSYIFLYKADIIYCPYGFFFIRKIIVLEVSDDIMKRRLEDGENSSDCGVVPSIDREHLDTGGFNLLADKVG